MPQQQVLVLLICSLFLVFSLALAGWNSEKDGASPTKKSALFDNQMPEVSHLKTPEHLMSILDDKMEVDMRQVVDKSLESKIIEIIGLEMKIDKETKGDDLEYKIFIKNYQLREYCQEKYNSQCSEILNLLRQVLSEVRSLGDALANLKYLDKGKAKSAILHSGPNHDPKSSDLKVVTELDNDTQLEILINKMTNVAMKMDKEINADKFATLFEESQNLKKELLLYTTKNYPQIPRTYLDTLIENEVYSSVLLEHLKQLSIAKSAHMKIEDYQEPAVRIFASRWQSASEAYMQSVNALRNSRYLQSPATLSNKTPQGNNEIMPKPVTAGSVAAKTSHPWQPATRTKNRVQLASIRNQP